MPTTPNTNGGGNLSSPAVYFLSGMVAVLMGYSIYSHLRLLNYRNANSLRRKRHGKRFDPSECIQDAIPLRTLAYLTQSNDAQIQGSAVDVVLERAMSDTYLPSIIKACREDEPIGTRANGLAALQLLTRHDSNRAALLAADSLGVLVDALKSTEPEMEEITQRYAAMAICDLIQGNDTNRQHIIDLEVLDAIIRILTSEHIRNNELKYWTLMILYQLSLCEPFPKVLIEKECVGLIATMARMTFGNTNMPKFCLQSLVRSIANVGEADAKRMLSELLDYDIVDLISISLRGDDVELIYWAVGLMHEFVIKDVAADQFRAIKGVHVILAGLLSAEEMYISRVVLRTVKFMAYGHEKFRQDMVRSGMVKKIMHCLILDESDVKHWAALCVHAVAAQVESHKDILGSPDFDHLLSYSEPTKPIAEVFISDILSLICCISSNNEHIESHIDGILTTLNSMLSSEEVEVQYNASGAIFNLVAMRDDFAAKAREKCLNTIIRISVSEGNERVQVTCAKICLVLAIKYQSLVTRITLEVVEPLVNSCVRIAQFTLPVIMIQSLIKAAEMDLRSLQPSSSSITSSNYRPTLGSIAFDTGAILPDYINVSASGSISNAQRLDYIVNPRHGRQYRPRTRRRRSFLDNEELNSDNSSTSSSSDSDISGSERNNRDRLPLPFMEDFPSADGSSLTGRMVEFVNFEIPPPSAKQLTGALSELRILLENDQTVGSVITGTVYDRLVAEMDKMQDAIETADLDMFEHQARRSPYLNEMGKHRGDSSPKNVSTRPIPDSIRQFLECLLYFTMYPIIGLWALDYTKDLDLDSINEKTAHNAYSDMLQWVYRTTRLRGAMDDETPLLRSKASHTADSQSEQVYTVLAKEYTGFSGRSLLAIRTLLRYASVRHHLVHEMHFIEVMVYMLQHCSSTADFVLSCLGVLISSDPATVLPEPSLLVLSTVIWKTMLQCRSRKEPLWFYSRLILSFAGRAIQPSPDHLYGNSALYAELDVQARTRYCIINNESLREVRNESWTFETVRGTHATPKKGGLSSDEGRQGGKYAFEVFLASDGLMQVGWVADKCEVDPEGGTGVGDDDWSYAYDGCRRKIWHGRYVTGQTSYGLEWALNDVITCCVDLSKGEMRFYKNGYDMGVAFDHVDCQQSWYPAISLSTGQGCRFSFGGPLDPLEYLPEGYTPLAQLAVTPMGVELPPPQSSEDVPAQDVGVRMAQPLPEEEEMEDLENAMRRMSVATPPLATEEGNAEPSLKPVDSQLSEDWSLSEGQSAGPLPATKDSGENVSLGSHGPRPLPLDKSPTIDMTAPALYIEMAIAFDRKEDELFELQSPSSSVFVLGLYSLTGTHIQFEYHATQARALLRQGPEAQSECFPVNIVDGDWIGLLYIEQPNRIGITLNGTLLVMIHLDPTLACKPVLPFKQGAIKMNANFGDMHFRWSIGNTPACKERMVEYLNLLTIN